MKNTLIFLRHANTEIELSKPARSWKLSKEGRKEMKKVAENEIFEDLDLVYASTEKKAIHTAFFIADKLKKEIVTKKNFDELNRKKPLENIDEYNKTVEKVFKFPEQSILGWETAKDALKRFSRELEIIEREQNDKKILIVSHGLVLSLYFGDLLRISADEIFKRWEKLDFCALGIVENNHVIRDIIKKNS